MGKKRIKKKMNPILMRGHKMGYVLVILGVVIFLCALFSLKRDQKKIDEEIHLLLQKCEEIEEYYQLIHEDASSFDSKLEDAIRYNVFQPKINSSASEDKEIENEMTVEIQEDSKSLKEQVYHLSSMGFSVKEIAKKLNSGEQEIHYMLEFKKKLKL